MLSRQQNTRVLLGEVVDLDPLAKRVMLADGASFAYDALIVAAGSQTFYYGHDAWRTTVIWARGVTASALGRTLAQRTNAETDRGGRIKVNPDLTVKRWLLKGADALREQLAVVKIGRTQSTHAHQEEPSDATTRRMTAAVRESLMKDGALLVFASDKGGGGNIKAG